MLDSKHILITGASSGIGAALAFEYAAPGVTFSLLGRNAERLAHSASRASSRGATVVTHAGDVTDANSMATWIAERNAALPLDLVIANAGISGRTSRAEELAEQAMSVFAVNVGGVFNTIHPVLPLMRERGRGQIAILSSLAGFIGLAGAAAYASSKAAVRVYGEALRAEMAPP